MNDLTLLYYTPNTNPEDFAQNVRDHLLLVTEGKIPIISVSQKPIDFGKNICVGEIGRSLYNLYKQVYLGALEAKTKYVALCEDDTLYNMEHFRHRPLADDVFCYNLNMWNVDQKRFWRKAKFEDMYNSFCIGPTKEFIKYLKVRFDTYPIPQERYMLKYWQEVGKFDTFFGIPNAKFEYFKTRKPVLTFNFRGSAGGKRTTRVPRIVKYSLKDWGRSRDLWIKFWGQL